MWTHLARLGFPSFVAVPRKGNFSSSVSWPDNKSFNVQSCSVNIVGYWPRYFLRFY